MPYIHISKSQYCSLWQCPKQLWLKRKRPELVPADDSAQDKMETGMRVGDLAKGLFGPHVDVTVLNDYGSLNIAEMLSRTQDELGRETPVICEAAFNADGLYCAVDILKKADDGYAIYEVKSSTHEDQSLYYADVAYQKYVLEHCGVCVTGTYLICINNQYIFDGTLDIQEFFRISDISEGVASEIENVPQNLQIAEEILLSDEEPDIDLDEHCEKPYPCEFWNYCARNIPEESVFDLYRISGHKKFQYYHEGYISYPELSQAGVITNRTQLRQMDFALHDRGTYAEADNIRDFLNQLSYPLYFLDFETMQPAVPEFVGTRPYAQIPFQYSLHYIESEGGELKHKEFLGISGEDPRRPIAEALVHDIPENVCVTAYNKTFECHRIQELAEYYPDLAEHLLNIRDHIVDLLVPFQKGYYYNRAMKGSFSIKSVLPAIFPDDPSLNYHNLDEVHNGDEAMTIFPQIQYMPPEQQEMTRHNLLKYCELDTYAMVKVWEELERVAATAE